MENLNKIWTYTCQTLKAFSLLLPFLVLIVSTTHLHYMEIVENDGLVICEVTDVEADTCTKKHKADNDNDNETVLVDFNFLKTNSLPLQDCCAYISYLPQYKNSYQFAFMLEMIRPPIFS